MSLKDIIEAALDNVLSDRGSTITYTRGDASVEVSAMPGKTQVEGETSEGFKVTYETRDYLMKRDSLVFDGVLVAPAVGDVITETAGATVITARVVEPLGKDAYSIDQSRGMIRVHTEVLSEVQSS